MHKIIFLLLVFLADLSIMRYALRRNSKSRKARSLCGFQILISLLKPKGRSRLKQSSTPLGGIVSKLTFLKKRYFQAAA